MGDNESTEPAVVEDDVVHGQGCKDGVPGVVKAHGHVQLTEECIEEAVVEEAKDDQDHHRIHFDIGFPLFIQLVDELTEEVVLLGKVVH